MKNVIHADIKVAHECHGQNFLVTAVNMSASFMELKPRQNGSILKTTATTFTKAAITGSDMSFIKNINVLVKQDLSA